MRTSAIASLVLATTLLLGFGARPASALICCSVCFENPHNPFCRAGCSLSCVEREPTEPDTAGEDDVAQVCYPVTASDAGDDAVTVASSDACGA